MTMDQWIIFHHALCHHASYYVININPIIHMYCVKKSEITKVNGLMWLIICFYFNSILPTFAKPLALLVFDMGFPIRKNNVIKVRCLLFNSYTIL